MPADVQSADVHRQAEFFFMLPRGPLRQADVAASVAFIAFGVVLIIAGARMPWTSTRTGGEAQWFLSPGLFPVVIGSLLILFSARVLASAIQEGGHRNIGTSFLAWLKRLPANRAVHRLITITLLMAAYIFLGVGRINFLLASFIFLFVTIAIFWWPEAGDRLMRYVLVTAAVSAVVPAVVIYLFSTFLYVAMP